MCDPLYPFGHHSMTWAIFRDAHTQAIVEMLQDGATERVVAVVGGALLDETLRRTLAERLANDEDTTDKLLKVGGALGNTEPKIDLLFLLGAVDRPTRNALYGLTHIRNFFAHNLEASFDSDDKKYRQDVTLLVLHEGRTVYPHHFTPDDSDIKIEDVKTNRDRFLVNLKLCLIALMRDRVSHVAHSSTPRTPDQIRSLWSGIMAERKKALEAERPAT